MAEITLDEAVKIADIVMEYRSVNRWFLPGTREKLIETIWNFGKCEALLDAVSSVLDYGEIDDPGNDPCDEARHDKWFYFHPALVL